MIDIDAVKSRLGSVSNKKLETLPEGIKILLARDFPYILKELKAARSVVEAANQWHTRNMRDQLVRLNSEDRHLTNSVLKYDLIKQSMEGEADDEVRSSVSSL